MPKTYTTQEAADELGRSYDHVRKMLAKFDPVQTIGRNHLWSKAQLNELRKLLRNS